MVGSRLTADTGEYSSPCLLQKLHAMRLENEISLGIVKAINPVILTSRKLGMICFFQ
jgi:hypothetical protein